MLSFKWAPPHRDVCRQDNLKECETPMQDAGKAADESMGSLSSRGRLLLEPSIGTVAAQNYMMINGAHLELDYNILCQILLYGCGMDFDAQKMYETGCFSLIYSHIPGASEKHHVLLKVFPCSI